MNSLPSVIEKQEIVKGYGKRFSLKILVETGTYLGDTVEACLTSFEKIFSIELCPELALRARKRFELYPHVAILQGDSSKMLQSVIQNIDEPCLFYLDAHYSGGVTVKGDRLSPAEGELNAILNNRLAEQHVILIDDARDFSIEHYPEYLTVNDVRKMVLTKFPQHVFEVSRDVMRIHRRTDL